MVKPRNLGHVVLRVRDVDRAQDFYTGLLDLDVMARYGDQMVFLSSGNDSSHELALMSVGPDAPGPESDRVGMYHFAWRFGSLGALRDLRDQLAASGVKAGVGNHGISIGLYFFDPDGNEIECYYELPKEHWPDGDIFAGKYFPDGLETELTDVIAAAALA